MRLSAVIPCYNGEETLPRQLEALTQQPAHALHEIIVANNMSTDSTSAVVARYAARDPRVREVSATSGQGAVFAQNEGVRASTGDFVMLCGADDEVQPGWANAFQKAFEAGATIAACTIVHKRETGTVIREVNSLSDLTWPGFLSVGGGQAGFSRAAFDEVDGFDEWFTGAAEDIDLFWRMQMRGHRVTEAFDAKFNYYARETQHDIFRQQTGYGKSKAQLFAKHHQHGMPRRSRVLAPIMLFVSAARFITSRKGSERRLTSVSTLGYNWGHIVGSITFRCWYM
ncbi:glycosyltransferase [Leucobacter chinensis]|uniref:glycosyltransferase n=1 Tax=Leucobacter chinensis TaxID=2851010 RepID=UPI001C217604|nr:glycosyltransferase [Leucobacter chinensis]